jgi:hypothetical protein
LATTITRTPGAKRLVSATMSDAPHSDLVDRFSVRAACRDSQILRQRAALLFAQQFSVEFQCGMRMENRACQFVAQKSKMRSTD